MRAYLSSFALCCLLTVACQPQLTLPLDACDYLHAPEKFAGYALNFLGRVQEIRGKLVFSSKCGLRAAQSVEIELMWQKDSTFADQLKNGTELNFSTSNSLPSTSNHISSLSAFNFGTVTGTLLKLRISDQEKWVINAKKYEAFREGRM